MTAASSSLSPAVSLLPLCSSSSTSSKPKLSSSFRPLQSLTPHVSLSSRPPSPSVLAAPEVMESKGTIESSGETLDSAGNSAFQVGGLVGAGPSPLAVGDDVDALTFGGDSNMPVNMKISLLENEALTSAESISSSKLSNPLQKDSSKLRVSIKNKYGEALVGILHETGSKELVVLCHGFRSSKESNTLLELADVLAKEGITVFRFDFSGNGESEGSFEYGNYSKEVDDLRAVILHFLGERRGVSAIVGHSKGGNVVLLYASIYHDIFTVVNVSGRFALERGIEELLGTGFMEKIKKDGFIDVKDQSGVYRVTEKSLMDRLTTDMHTSCTLIDKNCRVLTVHGSADETVPVEDAMEFAKLIPNHKLQIIEGANHRYTRHQVDLTSSIVEFVSEYCP